MIELIKKKWLKALRSGKFKQTRGLLKDGQGGYCCLGVLCELYLDEHKETTWEDLDISRGETESGDVLPEEVKEWAELENDNPVVDSGIHKGEEISEFNDGNKDKHIRKRTFKQIAGIIEKNL